MSLVDRLGRSLFVALAVGLAWGIRGDFGHLVGAMYPGAVLALGLAYVSGGRAMFLWMPILASLSALAIGSGGMMSYGILHGYAQADTLPNYAYGFLALFLQGGAWGTFGGALIGLMLERRPMRTAEWLGLLGSLFLGGWVASFVIVDVLGFRVNPPRNDDSVAFVGAAIGQLAWLVRNDRPVGLRGALLGFLGFGLGMAAGRLLGNVANALQEPLGSTINHWNVMETSCGFLGGFLYCFGMVGHAAPEPPEDGNIRLASAYGIAFVLGLLPLWHRLARIRPEVKRAEWAAALASYGSAEPGRLAGRVLLLLDGVCVLGFLGAATWAVLHFRRRSGWAALPVLWLSATMLLFQNLNALYFFYPPRPKVINMHTAFWVLFGLMALFAAVARPREAGARAAGPIAVDARPPWVAWLAGALAALGLVILLAGLVNGPATMRTANTRWPVWSWRDGPFPGRAPSR